MFGSQPASQEQHQWAVGFCNDFVQNNFRNWSAFFD